MEFIIVLLTLLNLLGAAQGILLAFALVSLKKSNQRSNKILAAFILTISIIVIGSVLYATGYIFLFPHAAQIFSPFQFLFGPLLLIYISALTNKNLKLNKKYFLHFIPSALCLAYYLPLYLKNKEGKVQYLTEAMQNYPSKEWQVKSFLLGLHILIYLAWAAYTLFSITKKEDQLKPSAGNSNFVWIRNFLISALIVWLAGFFRLLFAYNPRLETMLIFPLFLSIWVYVLGYMALKSPEVLSGFDESISPVKKRYEKSTLTPVKAGNTLNRLLQLMKTEKPYKDPEITLQKLAARLAISPHHLSQIINEHLNQNFFDFINSYRIEEVKSIMADLNYKHLSIIAIAEQSGFSSKSSFNSLFKKHTGATPSEFRKGLAGTKR